MPNFICCTCGTQYGDSAAPPRDCLICSDERQYIGWNGQTWTTLDRLRAEHHNRITPEGSGLTGIGTEPKFAIGQRALHVRTPGGGILWDCISLIDDTTTERIRSLGGVTAMAISHPHYYSSMIDGVARWVTSLFISTRPTVRGSSGMIAPSCSGLGTPRNSTGVTLIRCGGHFPGATVLHWADGADGLGALLSGDVIMVGQDRRTAGFMHSYPNYIPLGAAAVRAIGEAVESFEFEQVYGAWFGQNILEAGKQAVRYSVRRYLLAISDRERQ